MKSLLIAHGHNYTYQHADIRVVKDWSEIYEIIVASER
jgi:hypothetical protein